MRVNQPFPAFRFDSDIIKINSGGRGFNKSTAALRPIALCRQLAARCECSADLATVLNFGDDLTALDPVSTDQAAIGQLDIPCGLQENASAFIDDAAGIECAAVPDDDAGNADPSGFGGDGTEVGGVACSAGNLDLDPRCSTVDQADRRPGCQYCFTLRGDDDAFVADVTAEQIDAAAQRRSNRALVDDIAGTRRRFEPEPIGNKVGICDIQGAGDKCGSIDSAARPDQNASRVHQPDPAIG